MKLIVFAAAALLATINADCETIVFSSGRSIEGTIIRTNGGDVTVLTDHGTYNFSHSRIKEIRGAEAELPERVTTNRIAGLRTTTLLASRQPWGRDVTQIPATVIDKGMFRHVPYVSLRSSTNYEINVYGDLENPAAIEVGVYSELITNAAAKRNCLQLIDSLLGRMDDREALKLLSTSKGTVGHNGMTFEITVPEDEDSYGGWWISVYSEERLNSARASDEELGEITMGENSGLEVQRQEEVSETWSATELQRSAATKQLVSFVTPSGEVIQDAEIIRVIDRAYLVWRKGSAGGMVKLADLTPDIQRRLGYDALAAKARYDADNRSRTQATQASAAAAAALALRAQQERQSPAVSLAPTYYPSEPISSGYSARRRSSGGSVYVKGYTRKDGTYVRPHTRRR